MFHSAVHYYFSGQLPEVAQKMSEPRVGTLERFVALERFGGGVLLITMEARGLLH
jgi:hypothetical protein